MSLSELKRRLEDPPAGIYLFHGTEDYLREYYVRQLIERSVGREDTLNLLRKRYEELTAEELIDYAQALPVFSQKKVLRIDMLDTDAVKAELAQALGGICADYPEYLIIIFSRQTTDPQNRKAAFTDIKKAAGPLALEIPVNEQDAVMLKNWMKRHAQTAGKRIESAAMDHLLSITGNGMLNLDNELQKIFAYAQGEEVTIHDIDAVTVRTIDAQIYELADALIACDGVRCMETADDLLEKFPDTMIQASVYNCFVRLYRVALLQAQGLSREKIADMLDMKGGTVGKNLRILRNLPLTRVRRIVLLCADTDMQLKRVSRDKRLSMEVFFLKIMGAVAQ